MAQHESSAEDSRPSTVNDFVGEELKGVGAAWKVRRPLAEGQSPKRLRTGTALRERSVGADARRSMADVVVENYLAPACLDSGFKFLGGGKT